MISILKWMFLAIICVLFCPVEVRSLPLEDILHVLLKGHLRMQVHIPILRNVEPMFFLFLTLKLFTGLHASSGVDFCKIVELNHICFVVTCAALPSKSKCHCADNSLAFCPREVLCHQKRQSPCQYPRAGNYNVDIWSQFAGENHQKEYIEIKTLTRQSHL